MGKVFANILVCYTSQAVGISAALIENKYRNVKKKAAFAKIPYYQKIFGAKII